MSQCIFCAIVEGVAPSRMVAESDRAIAFLDIAPLTPGHTLVIPRIHSENLVVADADDLAATVELARHVAPQVTGAVDGTAFHLMSNTGADALQTVFHTHLHIMPRSPGDHFPVDLSGRGATPEQLDEVHERILASMG